MDKQKVEEKKPEDKKPEENQQTQNKQQEEIKAEGKDEQAKNEKEEPISMEDLQSLFQMAQYNARSHYDDPNKPRQFWDTQPVPKLSQKIEENKQQKAVISGPIEVKKLEQVRQTGYNLPEGFEWCNVNLEDDAELTAVYTLLYENYVEDDDNMFRFDYSKEFLRWALTPPGYYKDWIVGVRVTKSKKLVGFISGILVHMILENNQKDVIKMAEINFLCVNKKLRTKRLAPVLIKEVTRRVNLKSVWQAVYTAGVLIPSPISQARYYHRSLNPKKLIEVKFSCLAKNQTISRVIKLFKLPEQLTQEGFKEMKKKDVSGVFKLLNEFFEKYQLHQKFTEEEIKHFFLPRNDVIYTYVKTEEKEGQSKVTDMFSFYYLPSTVIGNQKYPTLRAVYSYYNIATTVSWQQLMEQALIIAKQKDYDVFNALDIMENAQFLKDLKFSPGDGNLHYYLYNWRMSKDLLPKDLGMVLV